MGVITITITMIAITALLAFLKDSIGIEFALILIILMFIFDGISIFLLKDILVIPNKEIALGILLGTITRVLTFLIKENYETNDI